ncbi:MAG: prolyl oligopeptidase family serine peptidase [Prosthecobacter sp.]|nr:prolyl oligopeptidase family serine peptidase [Prosthecobacter sp.]
MKFCLFALTLLSLCLHAASVEEVLKISKTWDNKLFRTGVNPVWLDEDHFWYRIQTGPGKYEFVRVNAEKGERQASTKLSELGLPEFENVKTTQSQEQVHASKSGSASNIVFFNRLQKPVKMVWIDTDGKHRAYGLVKPGGEFRQSTFAGHVWLILDAQDQPLAVVTARQGDLQVDMDGPSPALRKKKSGSSPGVLAPNQKWSAWVEQGKLMLSDRQSGKTLQVKTDLDGQVPFQGGISWAPDSSCFVVSAAKDVPKRQITLIESSPKDQVQPKQRVIDYPKPGDSLPQPFPVIIRLTAEGPKVQVVKPDLFPNPFIQSHKLAIRWAPDSQEFTFDYNQRGHQLYRILAVNAQTAEPRIVVEETSKTFIDYTQKTWRQWLDKTGELLWMSERDGWCHLWLYDPRTGRVKSQVTQGGWVVRKVDHVDVVKRQIWFLASGLHPQEDPYHQHLCRANLDGTGFQQLTESDGDHEIEWSPNKQYFIATWSRADHPPVTELRRSADGHLLCVLETADASALFATGWQMPERFVAKGRDGQTDIHGVIIKPSFFDPTKKYPVVEQVYAGPHSAFAPKDFGLRKHHQTAELGFIVVQSDGMGTNHRGKLFHDVCWKNLKDAGFPDRIAWIKAAAQTRPWMDLTRVGIYGGSAGGQSAMRALLDHSDFYQVAVADCGCHDNRMDKVWWNEQWMGWPVDESYARSSNVEDAAKLQGDLLLIVGELDTNVDPATTFQVVNALQRAGKPFEFMSMMGTGHSAAETAYGNRLRMEFLVKHLHP